MKPKKHRRKKGDIEKFVRSNLPIDFIRRALFINQLSNDSSPYVKTQINGALASLERKNLVSKKKAGTAVYIRDAKCK